MKSLPKSEPVPQSVVSRVWCEEPLSQHRWFCVLGFQRVTRGQRATGFLSRELNNRIRVLSH